MKTDIESYEEQAGKIMDELDPAKVADLIIGNFESYEEAQMWWDKFETAYKRLESRLEGVE